jgi:hypothetical protein
MGHTSPSHHCESHPQVEELAEEDRWYLGDDYKREVVEKMSVSQLVDTIMTNPTVSGGLQQQ